MGKNRVKKKHTKKDAYKQNSKNKRKHAYVQSCDGRKQRIGETNSVKGGQLNILNNYKDYQKGQGFTNNKTQQLTSGYEIYNAFFPSK